MGSSLPDAPRADRTHLLREKLGPLVLQFPSFNISTAFSQTNSSADCDSCYMELRNLPTAGS